MKLVQRVISQTQGRLWWSARREFLPNTKAPLQCYVMLCYNMIWLVGMFSGQKLHIRIHLYYAQHTFFFFFSTLSYICMQYSKCDTWKGRVVRHHGRFQPVAAFGGHGQTRWYSNSGDRWWISFFLSCSQVRSTYQPATDLVSRWILLFQAQAGNWMVYRKSPPRWALVCFVVGAVPGELSQDVIKLFQNLGFWGMVRASPKSETKSQGIDAT